MQVLSAAALLCSAHPVQLYNLQVTLHRKNVLLQHTTIASTL